MSSQANQCTLDTDLQVPRPEDSGRVWNLQTLLHGRCTLCNPNSHPHTTCRAHRTWPCWLPHVQAGSRNSTCVALSCRHSGPEPQDCNGQCTTASLPATGWCTQLLLKKERQHQQGNPCLRGIKEEVYIWCKHQANFHHQTRKDVINGGGGF